MTQAGLMGTMHAVEAGERLAFEAGTQLNVGFCAVRADADLLRFCTPDILLVEVNDPSPLLLAFLREMQALLNSGEHESLLSFHGAWIPPKGVLGQKVFVRPTVAIHATSGIISP